MSRPTSTDDHQGHLDQQGYTDVTTGEHISLRDASPLGTDVTGIEGSGDVTLYSNKTHKHHTVLRGTGNPSDSRRFIADHNKQLRSHIIEDNRPPASIDELEQQMKNRERRAKEVEEGHSWSPN